MSKSRREEKLREAFLQYRDEVERVSYWTQELEEAEDQYLRRWASLRAEGYIVGNNAEERKAQEVTLLDGDLTRRKNARIGLRRAELWYELAKKRLNIAEFYAQQEDKLHS